MRKVKLAKNMSSSLVFQLTAIICGFILPRYILVAYGSKVNGIVNSISQFILVITFFDLGMGAVVKSALYKPLVDGDNEKLSQIIVSAEKFFKRLLILFFCYIALLTLLYPFIIQRDFSFTFTMVLILAMSVSSILQYYLGITDKLLLIADQREYIVNYIQTATLLLNTVGSVVLIYFGASIQAVKIAASTIYLLRPVMLRWYEKKYYTIQRDITYKKEPIKQKWNGIAQHIAAVVLDGTDIIVLTVFATMKEVSVYSLYNFVVYNIKQMTISVLSSIQPMLGELWAKRKMEELSAFFGWIEWGIHTGVTYLFGCTGILLMSFINVYTKGITDAEYAVPLFSALITLAHAAHCLRLPYQMMILAVGHYKQTQWVYVAAAALNIGISILGVRLWGLIGVAIGTFLAMLYQTVWMAIYNAKNFFMWSIKSSVKQWYVDFLTIVLICIINKGFAEIGEVSYKAWIVTAVLVSARNAVVVMAINMFFYRKYLNVLKRRICRGIFI